MTLVLNIDYSSVTTATLNSIVQGLAQLMNFDNPDSLTIINVYSSSTGFVAQVDQANASQVQATMAAVANIGSGSSIGGFSVLSSTFQANGISNNDNSRNLAIILGVVLPSVTSNFELI